MAVAQAVLTDTQRSVLEALCDTFVPAVEFDTSDPVERDFMARAASDLPVAAQVEGLMAEALVHAEIEAFGGLLDALAAKGFLDADLEARTAMIHAIGDADPAVESPEIKERLKRNTDEAVARGVKGIPTVVVGNEVFWGEDHLEEAAAAGGAKV